MWTFSLKKMNLLEFCGFYDIENMWLMPCGIHRRMEKVYSKKKVK